MPLKVKKILLIILMGSVLSCAYTPPHADIAATKIAIEYMNKSGAAKKAPRLFKKSVQHYARANKLLKQKENVLAQRHLHLARTYAEKAEFKSRTKINEDSSNEDSSNEDSSNKGSSNKGSSNKGSKEQ